MCNLSINCDICSGKIKNIVLIDTNNYELCDSCKDEEKFLNEWREQRKADTIKKRKIDIGVNLIQNEYLYDNVISHILKFL
jgi:hypothetical protein